MPFRLNIVGGDSIELFRCTKFFVSIPTLCLGFPGISNAEARQPGKAPNFSVNWTVGDQALEVINATTGKDDMGRPSRLCKHALYSRWVRLHSKVQRAGNATYITVLCKTKIYIFIFLFFFALMLLILFQYKFVCSAEGSKFVREH